MNTEGDIGKNPQQLQHGTTLNKDIEIKLPKEEEKRLTIIKNADQSTIVFVGEQMTNQQIPRNIYLEQESKHDTSRDQCKCGCSSDMACACCLQVICPTIAINCLATCCEKICPSKF